MASNVAIYTREWSTSPNVVNGIAFDIAHLEKYILLPKALFIELSKRDIDLAHILNIVVPQDTTINQTSCGSSRPSITIHQKKDITFAGYLLY